MSSILSQLLWGMRIFLYIAALGYFAWVGSEIAELLAQGYTQTVFILTATYHLLAGLGIWGLHAAHAQSAGILSLAGAILISLSFLALVYFPIGAMQTGSSPTEFARAFPFFRLAGLVNLIGFVLFGLAVLRAGVFSKWIGPLLILGNFAFVALLAVGAGMLTNFVSIGLAFVVLWMIKIALSRAHDAVL